MDTQQLKQSIDRVEECADQAKRAVQSGAASSDLRQAVDTLHQQARQVKQSGATDEGTLRQAVMQLEQTADRAKQACKSAGQVDPQLQQAIQRAHDELSQLKKQLQADSPA